MVHQSVILIRPGGQNNRIGSLILYLAADSFSGFQKCPVKLLLGSVAGSGRLPGMFL